MKNLKSKKGITLIALIISIVLLLILGVILIRELEGNGIISKAKEASLYTSKAQAKEKLELVMEEWKICNANDDADFKEFLEEKFDENSIKYLGNDSYTIALEEGKSTWYIDVRSDGTRTELTDTLVKKIELSTYEKAIEDFYEITPNKAYGYELRAEISGIDVLNLRWKSSNSNLIFLDYSIGTYARIECNKNYISYDNFTEQVIVTVYDETDPTIKAECVIDFSTWKDKYCFSENTPVLTKDGLKEIKDIKIGDMVYSLNMDTNITELKEVEEVFCHNISEKTDLCNIYANGEVIQCTLNHPIYKVGQGWIEAKELKTGDKLLNSNGEIVIIEQYEITKAEEENIEKVYNIKVKDNHNYYVGNEKILVHNKPT